MSSLVSILTPSYNQGEWLRDNLASVQGQTYEHIEHIVMDGGSSDESVEVLQHAGANVHWTSEPDRGQSHALNKAFTASSGDIIGWLNSDDAFVDAKAVEMVVATFERYPDVGVVYGHGLLVGPSNRVLQVVWSPPFIRKLINLHTYFVQPSTFIRRSVLSEPFVNEQLDFVMDRDLWVRLLGRTRFKRINRIIALDRHQPARKSLDTNLYREWAEYEKQRGVDLAHLGVATIVKAEKILCRLGGVPAALSLPSGISPILTLDFGSPLSRLTHQVLLPRKAMSQE